MRYRMIGIDLDGTLLDRKGRISKANLDAINRARDAGVLVVPCTGRAWSESRAAIAELEGVEIGVFVGGAAVSDIATGKSLDIAVIEPHLAKQLVDHLEPSPEAVLVFRDANLSGHDYLVTGKGSLSSNTRWWFEFTGAKVHFQRDVQADDLHHALRVGIVTGARRMKLVADDLREHFRERTVLQWFAAVNLPDPTDTICVLEVFARGVDKWRGLTWVAQQHGIRPEEIAAIGDEINDVAMLEGAALGVAMGNAIDAARAVADVVTADNNNSGVAQAIERMLSGEW